jgi:hypothetical protein
MNDSITWATVISPRSEEIPRLPRSLVESCLISLAAARTAARS